MDVSVLTPSYNQARFLAENLASVAAQGPVEHIVVDGGSTDGSRELLEASSVKWVSEPDRGQGEALNKGLRMARGEIIGWLNSDDLYRPGAVARAVALLDENPQLDMVYGHSDKIDAEGRTLGRVDSYAVDLEGLLGYATIPQPSTFLRRAALERAGGIDTSYRYAMDYDLWLRLGLQGARWRAVDESWACFRIHDASKTVAEGRRFLPEVERAMEAALASPLLPRHLEPRRLRARFHSNLARAAYANLDLTTARREFARAARLEPREVAWPYALKSLLPSAAVAWSRAVLAARRR
jgi:glycosyltransferase involved in cell wall biosynthesis